MDIMAHEGSPTVDQIKRACTMYSAGARVADIREALSDATTEAVFLACCAAIAAFNVEERLFHDDLV
jgi:hypothetical protein